MVGRPPSPRSVSIFVLCIVGRIQELRFVGFTRVASPICEVGCCSPSRCCNSSNSSSLPEFDRFDGNPIPRRSTSGRPSESSCVFTEYRHSKMGQKPSSPTASPVLSFEVEMDATDIRQALEYVSRDLRRKGLHLHLIVGGSSLPCLLYKTKATW